MRSARIASAVIASLLALGVLTIWCISVACIAENIQMRSIRRMVRTELKVTADGTPVMDVSDAYRREFVDLAGAVVESTAESGDSAFFEATFLRRAVLPPKARARRATGVGYEILGFGDGTETGAWYLVIGSADEGAYFEGYDLATNQRLGFVGRAGFQPIRPLPAERFSVDLVGILMSGQIVTGGIQYNSVYNPRLFGRVMQPRVYLIEEGELLSVDLSRKSVERIATDDPVVSAGIAGNYPYDGTMLNVRTEREILTLREDEVTARFPLPPNTAGKAIGFYQVDDHRCVLEIGKNLFQSGERQVVAILDSGEVLSSQRVNVEQLTVSLLNDSVQVATMLPAPLALGAFGLLHVSVEAVGNDSVGEVANRYFRALIFHVAVGLALAAWVLRREKRLYRTGLGWPLFVLLLGLPGLFGYLFHRRWPALSACQSCHQRVTLEQLACPVCGDDVVVASPTGTEVFA